MIVQLQGNIIGKTSTEVVIDCAGVGYSAMISLNTSEKLPEPGEKAAILTLLLPREDAMLLFGFADEAERKAFKLLTSVSGIGPKTAIGILSAATVGELSGYIIAGNLPALKKLPGIGKKTAERILLELKDKVYSLSAGMPDTADNLGIIKQEALAALTTLGFSRALAEKSVNSAAESLKEEAKTAEIIIKLALKFARL